jgi:hypothetical protein
MPESISPAPWQLAYSRLPAFMQCADDLRYGVSVRPKDSALEFPHIRFDARGFNSVMLFDIDDSSFGYVWDDKHLPEPSWISVNPANGHSHLAYVLERPVVRIEEKNAKPVRLFNLVRRSFRLQLGADPAYSGTLTKNPLSAYWHTRFSNNVYSLSYLLEWIHPNIRRLAQFPEPESGSLKSKGLLALALGRNDYVFNATRQDAYSHWDYLVDLPKEGRIAWLLNRATAHNQQHGATPLTAQEIRQIAKSISEFIVSAYDPAKGRQGLPQRQRHRQSIKAQRQRQSTEDRIARYIFIAMCAGHRITIKAAAEKAGISRQAMHKHHSEVIARIKKHNSQLENTSKDQQLRGFDSYCDTMLAKQLTPAHRIEELIDCSLGHSCLLAQTFPYTQWLKISPFLAHNRPARPRLGRTI